MTITNDGATILRLLEVEHPAAKVLVQLSELQDQEVGDGTTSVVLFAAELLRRGNELVKNKIHPTSIIAGYRLAMRQVVKFVEENLTKKLGVAYTPHRYFRALIIACSVPPVSTSWARMP